MLNVLHFMLDVTCLFLVSLASSAMLAFYASELKYTVMYKKKYIDTHRQVYSNHTANQSKCAPVNKGRRLKDKDKCNREILEARTTRGMRIALPY